MREITTVTKVAKYDELTKEQKTKVLENYRDFNTDHNWWASTYKDGENLLGILGFSNIDIQFSGFSSQGDGASFTATFSVPQTVKELKERIKAFKEIAPKDALFNFSSLRFDKDYKEDGTISIYRTTSHYCHSNTVKSDHDGLTNFVRDYSQGLYRRLENEYDYLTNDEQIATSLETNDYEFNIETGKIV